MGRYLPALDTMGLSVSLALTPPAQLWSICLKAFEVRWAALAKEKLYAIFGTNLH